MKNDIRKLLCLAIGGIAVIASTIIAPTLMESENKLANAASTSEYALVFNKDKNNLFKDVTYEPGVYQSGTGVVKTQRNTSINVSYSNTTKLDNGWLRIGASGSYSFETPIKGMTYLEITLAQTSDELEIKYGYDNRTSTNYYRISEVGKKITFNFNNRVPNYLALNGGYYSNDILIESMKIGFGCENSYYNINYNSLSYPIGTFYTDDDKFLYGDKISLEVNVRDSNYVFKGYFINGECVSTRLKADIVLNYHQDIEIEARVVLNENKLTVVPNNSEFGYTSTNGGTYLAGKYITVNAYANDGYYFAGWYDQSNYCLSNLAKFSFTMPGYDYVIEARFKAVSYNVTLDNLNTNYGSVTGGGRFEYNSDVHIQATPNQGYQFIGWFEGDVLFSDKADLTFKLPARDLKLTAKFDKASYNLTVKANDPARGTVTGSGLRKYGSRPRVSAKPNPGYGLLKWEGIYGYTSYDYFEFTMPNHDLVVTANFQPLVKVNVNYDETKGVVDGAGDVVLGGNATLNATPNKGFNFFEGWYDETGKLITKNAKYSFKVTKTVNIEARFTNQVMPNQFFTFGSYPQSKIYDKAVIDELMAYNFATPLPNDSKGWTVYPYAKTNNGTDFAWYLDFDHKQTKIRAVYLDKYRDINGNGGTTNTSVDQAKFNLNTIYFFAFSSLNWETDKNGIALANTIIDSQPFTKHSIVNALGCSALDYSNAYIREWLNNEFINTAFTKEEQEKIKVSNIDNSPASMGFTEPGVDNFATCDDKVFLLSNTERRNFNCFDTRIKYTQYARIMGLYDNFGESDWMLRSPDTDYPTKYIKCMGTVEEDETIAADPYSITSGIIPAFRFIDSLYLK